ncbi:sugar phosphate isomerase/epimerase [Alteromonas sp. ASW11-19]|uniref:Sugar phosphate isomerase/epimerase n=2 Tax=Alteromonas salexigens TaxID=2982530 RepID=A0ABT2VP21_9ALTE|nr:sugar phosphate isomerase/epimerase [Alteromonas salexigens]MCU7554648.1 sugar phosphate isomerase/epimerase [Alteromonas salexigens]
MLTLLPASLKAGPAGRKPVGLQLYTLREMMKVSVPATLKLVAAVGYSDLEFAGYFGHSAKDIRSLLDDEGLSAPAAHVPLDTLATKLDVVIEDALTVGHKYIVMPYLTDEQRGSGITPYYRLAANLNRWGEQLKQAGLQLAYHNHDFEFATLDGEQPFQVLLKETDANLMKMELDLYWTAKAKQDPLALFAAHPGRFPLWHVKDMASDGGFADVGSGNIDFAPIFARASQAGLQYPFVERDHTDDKLTTIQRSYKALSSLVGNR